MMRRSLLLSALSVLGCTQEPAAAHIVRAFELEMGTDSADARPVNTPPVAVDDAVEVDEDDGVVIEVLSNDVDDDGDALTVFVQQGPADGTAELGPEMTVRYAPRADFNGVDSFVYTVLDGRGGRASAVVQITVRPVNDAPALVAPTPPADGAIAGTADEPLEFVIAATDVDGDELEYGYEPFETLAEPPTVTDGAFSWTPSRFDIGVTFVTVWASDGAERASRDLVLEIGERPEERCGDSRCGGSDVCFHDRCFPFCVSSSDCGNGDRCWDGRCAESACEGVACPDGQECAGGSCYVSCSQDGDCETPDRCFDGRCAFDACEDLHCEAGRICTLGRCAPPCSGEDACAEGSCFSGACLAAPCADAVCASAEACADEACVSGHAPDADAGGGPRFEPAGGCGCATSPSGALPLLLVIGLGLGLRVVR